MRQEIIIQNRKIGKDHPCFIVAEACVNHMGKMDLAKSMIDIAVVCGVDAVKFQYHIPDEEMLKDVPQSSNFDIPLYEILEKYALKLEQHKELKEYCDKKGIIYMCTPFSKRAADEIAELVPVFKIGSGETTDIPTLMEIAKKEKPMIISTGMTTLEEIEETINALKDINDQIILMNCTSEYPAKYEDVALGVIKKLQQRFNIIVGHSDHTPDNYTAFAAVASGAKVIEKHFILDKTMPTPDQSVSIDPMQLFQLVEGTRKIEKAMGSTKKIHKLEEQIKNWARRSVVAIKDIKKGEAFSLGNIWSKRPGTGIPSKEIPTILGKKAKRDIKENTLLKLEDIE